MIFLFVAFATLVIFFYFRSHALSQDYPTLSRTNSLKDTIVNIISDGRETARVTFKHGEKFTLPWARTVIDGKKVSLPLVVEEGDILIKNENSDTTVLIRNHDKYVFVLYETLNEAITLYESFLKRYLRK